MSTPIDHQLDHYRGNPPVFLTPLLGREQDIAHVCLLLQRPGVRVLTLVGPGGVGKTRLGLAVSTQLYPLFEDGVCFVSLAPLSDPHLVLPALAQQLEIKEAGGSSVLNSLITALKDRHLLLLLDNMEQIVAAAPLLAELLAACPRLKVLLTSRAVLRLSGEQVFPVAPLALPDLTQLPNEKLLAQQAAVALFLQRAQAMQPDFELSAANSRAVAEICVRLDGLPLAIELAAARIRLLQPYALQARLKQSLSLLTKGSAMLPARQQTLRDTLQWNYNLLDAHEQRLFRCLSIFVGSFTLEAAEGVGHLFWQDGQKNQAAAGSVLDGVDSLLEKSLLYQVQRQTGEPRLAMLETIREYGLECLAASGELERVRQARATYYHALVREAGPHLRGLEKGRWLDQLDQEHENLRAVLNGLLAQGEAEPALHLSKDLFWFWSQRNYSREGRMFVEKGLTLLGNGATRLLAWSLDMLGVLATLDGDLVRAMEVWQRSRVLFQEVGDRFGLAWIYCNLGIASIVFSEYAQARQLLEESLVLFREREDQGDQEDEEFLPAGGVVDGIGHVLYRLAWLANIQGEYAEAWELAEESVSRFQKVGDRYEASKTMEILASTALHQGNYVGAQHILAKKLLIDQEDGNKADMSVALALQGQLALLQAEIDRAHALLTESIALLREIASREMVFQPNLAEALSALGRVVARQGDLARAFTLHEESLAAAKNTAMRWCIAFSLEGLAEAAVAQDKVAWAARLWGAAQALREPARTPLPAAWHPAYERAVALTRTILGEQAFSALWETGRTLPLNEVLVEPEPAPAPPPVQAVVPPSTSPISSASAAGPGLTPREMDVLRLLAQGLTNAQIAEQLIVSLVTVNFHVRSLYSKLGVTSRTAATRYALEHHLV